MTLLSQILQRSTSLWSNKNANNLSAMIQLILPKKIIQSSHRPFHFMIPFTSSTASTIVTTSCAIGILTNVLFTEISNENDIYQKDTTFNKLNSTARSTDSSSSDHSNDSNSSLSQRTAWFRWIRNYPTNNNNINRLTYCESATYNNSMLPSSKEVSSSLLQPQLDTGMSSNEKSNAPSDDITNSNHDGVAATTTAATATTAKKTPTIKSNIQRQV